MDNELRTLTAQLLAERALPRSHPSVRRALVDESFRLELDSRLRAVGLRFIDNPYATHVSVALTSDQLDPVFGCDREYQASNAGLTRDEVALLVVLWALIILPKRERQVTRQTLNAPNQSDLFGKEPPMPQGDLVSLGISEASLIADFGPRLGGKTKLKNFALGKLARLGFIERKNGQILEGPLLDVLLDYRTLADRIIHGTLAELLTEMGHPVPEHSAFERPDETTEEADEANEASEDLEEV